MNWLKYSQKTRSYITILCGTMHCHLNTQKQWTLRLNHTRENILKEEKRDIESEKHIILSVKNYIIINHYKIIQITSSHHITAASSSAHSSLQVCQLQCLCPKPQECPFQWPSVTGRDATPELVFMYFRVVKWLFACHLGYWECQQELACKSKQVICICACWIFGESDIILAQ